MFRKRRRPTPGFGIPPPFMPMTGEHATLLPIGIFPYCAMMQVAAADTYVDYVICRGFDPRIRRFIDYAAGNSDKPGISVAKPYGKRVVGTYEIGQVFPALLPTQGTPDHTPPSPSAVDWRVGQNPGVTDNPDAGGHPQSLSDAIEELIDHKGAYVNWILLDSGEEAADPTYWYLGKTTQAIASLGNGTAELYTSGWTASGTTFTVHNPHDIELPSGLKIRWASQNVYYGWSTYVAEPWQWTECPAGGY